MGKDGFVELALARAKEAKSDRIADAIRSHFKLENDLAPDAQRPHFRIPWLPSKPWYESVEFEWARRIECMAPVIVNELQALREVVGFQPYHSASEELQEGQWNMFYFSQYGHDFCSNRGKCPETSKALDGIPGGTTGTNCFSALIPGTHIKPHCGPVNTKIRFHLGLSGLDGCSIRVGETTRPWIQEKLICFDDSFEHEVWHKGKNTRFILMFDIWHPDLSKAEIRLLQWLLGSSLAVEEHLDIIDRHKADLGDSHASWWK